MRGASRATERSVGSRKTIPAVFVVEGSSRDARSPLIINLRITSTICFGPSPIVRPPRVSILLSLFVCVDCIPHTEQHRSEPGSSRQKAVKPSGDSDMQDASSITRSSPITILVDESESSDNAGHTDDAREAVETDADTDVAPSDPEISFIVPDPDLSMLQPDEKVHWQVLHDRRGRLCAEAKIIAGEIDHLEGELNGFWEIVYLRAASQKKDDEKVLAI